MKSETQLLEHYFNSFFSQGNDWDFFLGLADYVKYVDENKTTNKAINGILSKRLDDFKKYNTLEKNVLDELGYSKNKILEIIEKNKINYASLTKELDDLKAFEEGRRHGYSKPEMFIDCLFNIARNMVENKHGELLNSFVDDKQEPKNIYGNFVFSKSLKLLREEKETIDYKEKTELWSAWNNLALAYVVIFRGAERWEELKKDKKNYWEFFNFTDLLGEMREIEEAGRKPYKNITPVHFKKEEYKGYTSRIHNFLLKELTIQTTEDKKQANISPIYDEGVLELKGKEIIISKNRDSNPHYLLKTIFKDKEKVWNFDEIAEDWNDEYKKDDWTRYYNAAYKVNDKVAKKTTIEDFLIATKKLVKINEKYL